MLATIESATVIGVDACRVHVEIDVSRGFPTFQLVGLPDTSIKESRDRVRAAMRNSGYEFPLAESPSTSRRAMCARPAPRSICPSRSACLPQQASSSGPTSPASSTSASCRSTDRSSRRAASCRSRRRRAATTLARCCCPSTISPKQPWSAACGCCRCGRSSEAVERLNQADASGRRTGTSHPRHPGTSAHPRTCRSFRPSRPGVRATRTRSRRGRRTQPADDRSAGRGQDDAGATTAGDPAAVVVRRVDRSDHDSLGGGPACGPASACSPSGRFARRITPSRTSRSSAAAARRGPARSAWRITACCSSTRCRSSIAASSRPCDSRSKKDASPCRARCARSSSPPASCWSPR